MSRKDQKAVISTLSDFRRLADVLGHLTNAEGCSPIISHLLHAQAHCPSLAGLTSHKACKARVPQLIGPSASESHEFLTNR